MNKPCNESVAVARLYGNQLRYISRRRWRKLRARAKRQGIAFESRSYQDVNSGEFLSWLMPIPLCREADACRSQ